MIDPLAVDEDALAQRSVPLAAGRVRRVMMVARRYDDRAPIRVATMAMVTVDDDRRHNMMMGAVTGRFHRRDNDGVMTVMASCRRNRVGDDVMVVTAMLHDNGRDRPGVMVAMMARRNRRGGRGVMVVVFHRGRAGAAREDGGGEGQGGDDGWA